MNAGINGIIDKIDSYTNAKAQDRFTQEFTLPKQTPRVP
jgi:hypothetical protein